MWKREYQWARGNAVLVYPRGPLRCVLQGAFEGHTNICTPTQPSREELELCGTYGWFYLSSARLPAEL